MTVSLSSFLEKKQISDYSDFLSPKKGYPIRNRQNCWVFTKNPQGNFTNKKEYFDFLAEEIAKDQHIPHLPKVEDLIKKFNVEWMKARKEVGVLKEEGESEIWFNSKSENYSWLSNFFQTLIYSTTPTPGIFTSSESAYKTYKQILGLGSITEDSSQETKQIAVSLMRNLIQCKFAQNSILAERLQATAPCVLVEHTDHRFWGDGSSTHSQIKGDGLNMLGQVLMSQRGVL